MKESNRWEENEPPVYTMTDRFVNVAGRKLRVWTCNGKDYVLGKEHQYVPVSKLETAKDISQEEKKPKEKMVYQGVEIVSSDERQTKESLPSAREEMMVEEESDRRIIENASKKAEILADIIEKKKLYSVIKGKKYTRVEGWEVLGALLHCRPQVISCVPTLDGKGYLAEAVIQRIEDNKIMSRGMAMCLRDETGIKKDGTKYKKWEDEHAVFSMAQTRAVGKAFRLGFSWIMSLAGYEPTPAEEMVR